MVPVVSDDNKIMGVVTEGNLMACLLNGRVQPEDVVESVMYKQFKKVSDDIEDAAQRWAQQHAGTRKTRAAPFLRLHKYTDVRVFVLEHPNLLQLEILLLIQMLTQGGRGGGRACASSTSSVYVSTVLVSAPSVSSWSWATLAFLYVSVHQEYAHPPARMHPTARTQRHTGGTALPLGGAGALVRPRPLRAGVHGAAVVHWRHVQHGDRNNRGGDAGRPAELHRHQGRREPSPKRESPVQSVKSPVPNVRIRFQMRRAGFKRFQM